MKGNITKSHHKKDVSVLFSLASPRPTMSPASLISGTSSPLSLLHIPLPLSVSYLHSIILTSHQARLPQLSLQPPVFIEMHVKCNIMQVYVVEENMLTYGRKVASPNTTMF